MKTSYGLVATLAFLAGGSVGRCEDTATAQALSAAAPADGSGCPTSPGGCKRYLPRGFDWIACKVPPRPWCKCRTYGGGWVTEWLFYVPACTPCKKIGCCRCTPYCTPPLYAFFLYPAARASVHEVGPPHLPANGLPPTSGTATTPAPTQREESKPANGKAAEPLPTHGKPS